MGTFTWSYFAKSFYKRNKLLVLLGAPLIYLEYKYTQASKYPATVMKGRSKLFSDRNKLAEKAGVDVWKW